jgi:heme-degrading monooxygenase HmoA
MVARVTLAEIDPVRTSVSSAVERFNRLVAPALREQEGYCGLFVLTTEEGKALVMSLWSSEDAADAALASGFYAAQVEQFVTFFRTPPGRETYEVALAETPPVDLL